MTVNIITLQDAEAARDRVVAALRHAICYDAYRARTARLARDRAEGSYRAFATGRALEAVLRELGDPGDRTLPKPDGELPLNPLADGYAREYLGSAADFLLGKRPVQ